jgi:hypothetical protein
MATERNSIGRLLLLAAAMGVLASGARFSTPSEPTVPRVVPSEEPRWSIDGVVKLDGEPRKHVVLDRRSDPACGTEEGIDPIFTREEVVTKGRVANVFVYISRGLEGRKFATPAQPALLEHTGCTYRPHVLGVMVNQPIRIVNNDATLHNVHATPRINRGFNFAQPNRGMENTKSFSEEEIMIPISCDVHGWERCYVGVLSHPFFAVTGRGGAFTLKGLPPGEYTVTAWHERYGKQDQVVTVGEKGIRNISFTFKQ